MSALNQIIASFKTPVVTPSYVGATPFSSAAGTDVTVNYPVGTAAGDLVIIAQHIFTAGGSVATPSGFTLVAQTSNDSNGYAFKVSTRVAASESSAVVPSTVLEGFDCALVVMRGHASASIAEFNSASGGGGNSITASGTASTILIASDRGAGGYPTVSSTARTATFSHASTYFKQTSGVYVLRPASTSISYTDVNDAEQSTGLFITVTP